MSTTIKTSLFTSLLDVVGKHVYRNDENIFSKLEKVHLELKAPCKEY